MNAARNHKQAIDRSDVPTVVVGTDQHISYANAAAHRMLGYPQGALIGLSPAWLAPPSRHGELRNISSVLEGQSARRIRTAALRADGSLSDVNMRLDPCHDATGKVVAVSITYEPAPLRTARPTPPPPPSRASLPPTSPSQVPMSTSQPAGRVSQPPARVTQPPARTSVPPSSPARVTQRPSPTMRGLPASPPPANTVVPRHSEVVRKGTEPREEMAERIGTAQQLLRWLDERLSQSPAQLPLDDPRERARAQLILSDARELLEECRRELDASTTEVPTAPKLPRV